LERRSLTRITSKRAVGATLKRRRWKEEDIVTESAKSSRSLGQKKGRREGLLLATKVRWLGKIREIWEGKTKSGGGGDHTKEGDWLEGSEGAMRGEPERSMSVIKGIGGWLTVPVLRYL